MKTAKEVIEQYELFKHETDELNETHIYLDNAIEAMEEFSSLKNRSLVEENERLLEALKEISILCDYDNDNQKSIYRIANKALSYKEEGHG